MNVCIDIPAPQIVAKVSLKNQTSSIPLTTIYTPASDGEFLVSVYLTDTSVTGSAGVVVQWTDEMGTWQSGPSNGGPQQRGTFMIHAIAGQPIQYFVDYSDSHSVPYNLFITVVQE